MIISPLREGRERTTFLRPLGRIGLNQGRVAKWAPDKLFVTQVQSV